MTNTTMLYDQEQISIRVVNALAAAANVDPLELTPPLYYSIDPTALDQLFEKQTPVTVEFEHDGHEVTVRDDGTVVVDGVPYDEE